MYFCRGSLCNILSLYFTEELDVVNGKTTTLWFYWFILFSVCLHQQKHPFIIGAISAISKSICLRAELIKTPHLDKSQKRSHTEACHSFLLSNHHFFYISFFPWGFGREHLALHQSFMVALGGVCAVLQSPCRPLATGRTCLTWSSPCLHVFCHFHSHAEEITVLCSWVAVA